MSQGTFFKSFAEFSEGLGELVSLSFSAKQAIEWGFPIEGTPVEKLEENDVVGFLANNVVFDRACGAPERCSIRIESGLVAYTTRSNLTFGWEYSQRLYTFFCQHPERDAIGEDSTLRRSAQELGWAERGSFYGDEILFL